MCVCVHAREHVNKYIDTTSVVCLMSLLLGKAPIISSCICGSWWWFPYPTAQGLDMGPKPSQSDSSIPLLCDWSRDMKLHHTGPMRNPSMNSPGATRK